jgi:hypothetical protein
MINQDNKNDTISFHFIGLMSTCFEFICVNLPILKFYAMKQNIISFILIILILNGCSSSLKVYSEYDKKVDFSQYKTFSFYEIKEEHLKMKEVNRRRLAMAIELELGMKGIKRNIDNPDLLVNLYSFINRKENVTTTTNQNAVGYYGAASPYGTAIGISVSNPRSYSSYYTNGTVTFHLVDRERNKLVLEGLAKVDASESDDADRIINYAVKKVFKPIPYKK